MKRIFFPGAIFACILLFSCASTQKQDDSPFVYITNSRKFFLLSADSVSQESEGIFLFSADFNGTEFSAPVFVKAGSDGIFLQILNDFGTSLATISYDGISARVDSAVLPENFKAEYVIADFQLAWCNFEKAESALNEISLSFTEEISSDKKTRILMDKKNCIEIFSWEGGTLSVENFLRGYKYSLTGVDDE